jgi:DMSO/TMAO reductase YedYZ molybdopterin-dependent catalytic subunit
MAAGMSRLMPWPTAKLLLAQSTVPKDRLIVRSVRPQDFETPVTLLDSWITPNERFYVRSHLYTPSIDLDTGMLRVDGEIERPLTLRISDLRQMPAVSIAVTLECAGNGRAFFDPSVAGVQWEKGAVGTARWTGVRLADVLQRAGATASARYVWLDGADAPISNVPDFVRQIPVQKALHPDTILAYEMNGVPLPVQHGFPLRAIVPGWEGAYSVKWLTHIQVSDREHNGFFVQTAYRYPIKPIPPGATVDAKDMAPLVGLVVKSIITSPLDGARLRPGPIRIAGWAWAGEANVTQVDVSTDGGRRWRQARLGRDQARYAWRSFEYEWPATTAGRYTLLARATDDQGRVQPGRPRWNPSGYLWNVVDRVEVQIGVDSAPVMPPRPAAPASLPDAPASALVQKRCIICHEADLISQQRLTRDRWTAEVDKMVRWGASIDDAEVRAIVDYLARYFGPR